MALRACYAPVHLPVPRSTVYLRRLYSSLPPGYLGMYGLASAYLHMHVVQTRRVWQGRFLARVCGAVHLCAQLPGLYSTRARADTHTHIGTSTPVVVQDGSSSEIRYISSLDLRNWRRRGVSIPACSYQYAKRAPANVSQQSKTPELWKEPQRQADDHAEHLFLLLP